MFMIEPIRLGFALKTLVSPVAYGLVIAGLFSICVRLIWKEGEVFKVFGNYASYSLPVALVGFSTGYLTAVGPGSTLGNVLPATLALIAGLSGYIFGTENKFKMVVGYCVCVFIFIFFVGIETGAYDRENQVKANMLDLSQLRASDSPPPTKSGPAARHTILDAGTKLKIADLAGNPRDDEAESRRSLGSMKVTANRKGHPRWDISRPLQIALA